MYVLEDFLSAVMFVQSSPGGLTVCLFIKLVGVDVSAQSLLKVLLVEFTEYVDIFHVAVGEPVKGHFFNFQSSIHDDSKMWTV